jgi:hypothetical protein
MTSDLEGLGVASGAIWFNNTINIDEAGACRACGGFGQTLPTFNGRNGVITSVYGGYGPTSNPDSYFNISQSSTLFYTPVNASGSGGGPNVLTGVSFYAVALDGSNSIMQVSTYCTGMGNSITGSGGSYTVDIPVNPSPTSTVTSSAMITSLPGQVSIHFSPYLWCGDVNQTTVGSYTVKITILPWTIKDGTIGTGSSGTVSWSRVELGQSSSNSLGANPNLPKGNIPEVILPPNPLGMDASFSSLGGSATYTVGPLNGNGHSTYESNYGFSLNVNNYVIDTTTSNSNCPPTGLAAVNANGGCGVNYWNGYEYAHYYVPAVTNGVVCQQYLATGLGSSWSVTPSQFVSTASLQVFSHPSFGFPTVTCEVTNPATTTTPGFSPSVTANAYLADTNVPTAAFMVPTALYGYMGSRATIDGGIAMPSYVHLTKAQLTNLAASSYVNISWWESWQNPLLQLMCPLTTCTSGSQGQPLFWIANISVGNTSAAKVNIANNFTDPNGGVAPLMNQSGCPGTAAFGEGTFNGYQAVANPNIPMNTNLITPYAFSGDFNNLSVPICQPTLYWNYTPPMPMPIGYSFFTSNTSLLGIYPQGQTVWADDYIFDIHVPGFMVRESYGVPGVAGIELPYPYTDFLSMFQNASTVQNTNSTIATWWWKTTDQANANCPYNQTAGWVSPINGGYQIRGGAVGGRIDNTCEQTAILSTSSLGGGNVGEFTSVDGMVSMTPVYGPTIRQESGNACRGGPNPCDVEVQGNPISPILNPYSVPNATAFTAHIPSEQVGGAVNAGTQSNGNVTIAGQGWDFNLSGAYQSKAYPEIQEFEVLLSPMYGAFNLNSVASASCAHGGLVNLTFPSGSLGCAGQHAIDTVYPVNPPTWGPTLNPPLNLSLSLQQATVQGYPITGTAGLGSNFVSPGPWYLRTSLHDAPFPYGGDNASALNSSCGYPISNYWAGDNVNLEPNAPNPPPQNHSDISEPYWWSNTSYLPPPCDGYQTYDAFSVSLIGGLLPYGNYTFGANATGFNPDSWDATINTPEINNASVLMCDIANTNLNNTGCNTKNFHVSLFSFSVHNISGPFNGYLTGTFITVTINGTGEPGLTIGMNDTSCSKPLSGFCNNTLILMTPKTWSGTVTLTDVMGSPQSLIYKPYGNETTNVHIKASKGTSTTSYSEAYYWSPIYSQCSLSGSCGCLYNCGSLGILGWLAQNFLNILLTIIAALIVAGAVYYLHKKQDDQMAGLVAAGGSFIVAAIAWVTMVASGNLNDNVFLALLITGASIIAPGIGLLLTMRTQAEHTVSKTTATFQTIIHRTRPRKRRSR